MSEAIAVDLDKTLAEYTGWNGMGHIGEPIPLMVDRVKKWLAKGRKVVIFTARVSEPDHSPEEIKSATELITAWCVKHIGEALPVTAHKRTGFVEFYDDKASGVLPNKGIVVSDLLDKLLCVLHHDTGEHIKSVGLIQAVEDAITNRRIMYDRIRDLESQQKANI